MDDTSENIWRNSLRCFKLSLVCISIAFFAPFTGCSEEDDDIPPPAVIPEIYTINGGPGAQSPVGVQIEINGVHFLSTPGSVRFDDGASVVDVTPSAANWGENLILAVVPSSFTPPMSVTVYVLTSEGLSNGVGLDLIAPVDPLNIAWSTTTSLPAALRGLKGVAVPHTGTHAYVYVSGGQTSSGTPANVSDVRYLGVTVSGANFTVDATWTPVDSLPVTRAFHAMAVAHSGNSSISSGNATLYVVGGQADASDTPGGTDTVYAADVNLGTGTLGTWTARATLPAYRWGHCAYVHQGRLFVVGGCDESGNPQDTIDIADVHGDGTLGAFTSSPTPMPYAAGSHSAFAYGNRIYVIGGEIAQATDPNDNSYVGGSVIAESWFAPVTDGVIGTFVKTKKVDKDRKKHVMWLAYDKVFVLEGLYDTTPSTHEFTVNDVLTDGTLSNWSLLIGSNAPGADVYNCAGVLSPISPSSGGSRFFIIGGSDYSTGNAVSTVWLTTAP